MGTAVRVDHQQVCGVRPDVEYSKAHNRLRYRAGGQRAHMAAPGYRRADEILATLAEILATAACAAPRTLRTLAPMTSSAQGSAMPFSPTRRRISWDLVRVLCVLLVVIYHSTFVGPEAHPEFIDRKFVFPYQVGASLLLLVSAYFACASIRKGDLPKYWWNRVSRLLPPFLAATVFAYVVMRQFSPARWFMPTLRDLGANLLMLWNWKPEQFLKLDESYWTVPLQLMAFTVAVMLWRSRWGHGKALRAVLWTAVLTPIVLWPYRIAEPPEAYRMLADGFGFHRLHLFVAGVAIWMWSAKKLGNVGFAALITTCLGAHALHNYVVLEDGRLSGAWGSTIAVWIGIAVVIVVASGADVDRFVPSSWARPIQWLAGISYGTFLVHQTAGYIFMRHLQDAGIGPSLQTVSMVAFSVVLGWALTRSVEQPVHRGLLALFDAVRARRDLALLREPSDELTVEFESVQVAPERVQVAASG